MRIECSYSNLLAIGELKPNPANPNQHPDKQVDKLAKLIQSHGWRHPITVSKRSGLVVSGHCRLLAAQKLGLKEAPVDYQDFESEAEELAVLVADNAVQDFAEIDGLKMADILVELDQMNYDLDLTALDKEQIEDYVVGPTDDNPQDDVIPDPPKKAITKTGDLWILGEHRVLCGDATKKKDVERLMNGKKAKMVFTDPPYDIKANREGGKFGTEGKGDYRISVFPEYDKWVPLCFNVLEMNSSFLVFEHWRNIKKLWESLKRAKFNILSLIIWRKTNYHQMFSPAGLWSAYDIILVGGKTKTLPLHKERITNIYDFIESPVSSKYETGQNVVRGCKPIQILTPYIDALTDKKNIVFEPFGGAGSTIIACEKIERKCLAIEIHGLHCDVIVKRWEQYTGKKAELANG